MPRLPRLTFAELWAFVAVALPVLGSLLASISTVDLAYQLRAGGLILDTGAIPRTDTFTFTAAGQPWIDQQWGAQLVLAWLERLGGWPLLALARAALVGLVSGLVLVACRRRGASLRVAAWLTLAGFVVGIVTLGMRPQLLGMACFAATMACLSGSPADRRWTTWLVPLVMAAWVNVHGSFAFGLIAIGYAWLDDLAAGRPEPQRILLVAGASAVVTFATPLGPEVWAYATGLASDPTIRRIVTEWQVTNPASFVGALFYGSVAVAALVTWLAAGRLGRLGWRRVLPTVAWLAGLAMVAAYAERGVAWWAIGAPVGLAGLLAAIEANGRSPDVRAPRRSVANSAVAVGLSVAIAVLLPFWRPNDPLYGPSGLLADAPRGITDALLAVARPGERIWNSQRWGSWLEYVVPASPVAVDSRIEVIPTDAWADHLALSRGAPGWSEILDRRNVAIVVASAAEQAGLIAAMRGSPGWRIVVDDRDGVVFVRAGRLVTAGAVGAAP